jgi:hypothetical protein
LATRAWEERVRRLKRVDFPTLARPMIATRGCSAGANDGFSFVVFCFSLKGKGLHRANRLFRVDGFNVVTNYLNSTSKE